MNLSCKLTHSILRYIESQGEDSAPVISATSVPDEFLRDPSYWIRVEDFETFLLELERHAWNRPDPLMLQKMARSCVEYRSWGVLDSVLRMMSSPGEVFSQPERFLSYFIAPAPPVDQVRKSGDFIAFDLPMSMEQYPRSCQFLSHSFEMVPVYMGLSPAACIWNGIRLSIDWRPRANPTANGSAVGKKGSSSVSSAATVGDVEPMDVLGIPDVESLEFPKEVLEIRDHVARLSDYMIRAQQLITLLVGSERMSPVVKEAMRRVDWHQVQTQFPQTVEQCYQIFRKNQENQRHV